MAGMIVTSYMYNEGMYCTMKELRERYMYMCR